VVLRAVRMGWSLLVGIALGLAGVRARRFRPLDFSPFGDALAGLVPERDRRIGTLLEGASIASVRALMDGGELSSEELTLHLLERVRRLDPRSCSVIELNPDALSEARAADERRRNGGIAGALDGIPVTVKDNIETAGPMHTTAGSMALAGHVATGDAAVVTALRQAGVVILGKANLSELAGAVARTPGVSAVGGETRNPYGERFTPGGSSSGSAVSVAAGLCLASIGTETSGSLIAPAAFNGVVGMKPSRGLVSREGIVPLVSTQDSAGPVARCVADAAAVLSVIANGELVIDLSPAALQGITVGILREDILSQRTPFEDTSDNAGVLSRIDDGLLDAGASAKDVAIVAEGGIGAFESGFARVVLGGLSHDTIGYLATAGVPVASVADLHAFHLRHPRARMPRGQFFVSLAQLFAIDEVSYRKAALEHRAMAAHILDATFDASGAEVLVSLSNRHSSLYATAGYPAITVPVGLRASGMPVGATLIGRAGTDARLLGYAYAFEQATLLRVAPPAA
jgi:amidase